MSSAEKNLFSTYRTLLISSQDLNLSSVISLSCSCAMCWLVAANLESSQLEKLFSTAVVEQCISIAKKSENYLLLPFQGGSVFPIFCDELPDEKNWRKNAEKSAWRSTNEEKENQYNDEKNSWRSKDENCAPVVGASRPLQRNKVGLTWIHF